MLDVKYNLTTSHTYLDDMAAALGEAYGEKIIIKNNGLVLPDGLGTGRFTHYKIDAGLGMVIMDCTFYADINFIRLPATINYFHALSFNITSISLAVNTDGNKRLHIGDSWKNKIFYSTAEKGLDWVAPRNCPIKMLVLIISHKWLMDKFQVVGDEQNMSAAASLAEDVPLQFSLDLDLELLLLIQSAIAASAPETLPRLFYKGYAIRLVALVIERLNGFYKQDVKLKYDDVIRVIDAVKKLEQDIKSPLMPLEELAKNCFMSQSKFTNMFRAMYGKNYLQFFQEHRIKKAAGLLLSGWDIMDAAKAAGFVNQSHFTRIFREYFQMTPKLYLDKIKGNAQ